MRHPAMLFAAWALVAGSVQAADAPTPATIAALPPERTAGRGANLPFIEYEAENGVTNGRLVGPGRAFHSVEAEASGRRAVRLTAVGDYVEFVLAAPADAVTIRYALPDSADGGGLDGEIAIYADGVRLGSLALTSRYGWYYGAYPFSNRPADGGAHHLFDESRLLLGRTLPSGARVRFLVEREDGAAWRVLDLADFEMVGPPLPRPAGALSIQSFGADPSGVRDSARAISAAVAEGRRTGRSVWIDPGRYRVERHIQVDRVTLAGAGPWYSVLAGRGVGLYGLRAPGGSRHVVLKDFAILGEVNARIDRAQLNGVGGALNESLIANLWIQHTKAGLWFDGPMHDIVVRDMRILDQAADGLNFHRGVIDALVENSFVRNSGDDGLAAWSHRDANARITFRRNTVIAPILANGIALYGGHDLTVEDNLTADSVTEGGGLHLGARFEATPFGGDIRLVANTVVRGGVWDANWRSGVGAFWIYALERPIGAARIRVSDLDLIDSSYEAILLKGEPITGLAFDGVRIDGAGTHALQLEGRGEASFAAVVATGLGGAGVGDCASGFVVRRKSGGSGWDDTACPAR